MTVLVNVRHIHSSTPTVHRRHVGCRAVQPEPGALLGSGDNLVVDLLLFGLIDIRISGLYNDTDVVVTEMCSIHRRQHRHRSLTTFRNFDERLAREGVGESLDVDTLDAGEGTDRDCAG